MDSSRGIISVKLFAYKTFSQVYHRGRFIGQKYQSYFFSIDQPLMLGFKTKQSWCYLHTLKSTQYMV